MGRAPGTRAVVSAAIALATALLMLLAACDGGGAPQEQAPTESFLELMAYVPAAREYQQVCFSNPRGFLDATGFEDIRTVEQAIALMKSQSILTKDLEALSPDELDKLFSVRPVSVPSLYTDYWSLHLEKTRDLLGVELFEVEDLLSTGSEYLDVVRGPFDSEAMSRTLEAQGYSREDHGGTPFYAISGDFDPTFIVDERGFETLTELGALVIDRMNRVWLSDGTLVAAPATQIMTDAMDAASGRIASILDRPQYRRTAESLGPVHAACLLDPAQFSDETLLDSAAYLVAARQLQEAGPEQNAQETGEEWDARLELARRGLAKNLPFQYPQWARLDPPALLALGYYREADGANVFKVGLWYDDKEKAKTNAAELQKRLAQYQSESWGKPLCDEAEAHSQAWSDGSLVVVECRGGLARQWTWALEAADLLFLLERLPGQ